MGDFFEAKFFVQTDARIIRQSDDGNNGVEIKFGDFFEKPFNDNKLMDRVVEALTASREAGAAAQVQVRLASLSTREREVLDLILDGKMNKVIADALGISMRTVEVHRAHIFDKMNVKTAVELARLLK